MVSVNMAFWRANVVQPLKVHLDNVKIPVEYYYSISCACRSPCSNFDAARFWDGWFCSYCWLTPMFFDIDFSCSSNRNDLLVLNVGTGGMTQSTTMKTIIPFPHSWLSTNKILSSPKPLVSTQKWSNLEDYCWLTPIFVSVIVIVPPKKMLSLSLGLTPRDSPQHPRSGTAKTSPDSLQLKPGGLKLIGADSFFCWEKTQPMEEVNSSSSWLKPEKKLVIVVIGCDLKHLKTIELGAFFGSIKLASRFMLPRLHSWGLHDPRSQTTCWSAWWPGRTDGWWISATKSPCRTCGQDVFGSCVWVRVQDWSNGFSVLFLGRSQVCVFFPSMLRLWKPCFWANVDGGDYREILPGDAFAVFDNFRDAIIEEPIPWYEWAEKYPGFVKFQEEDDGRWRCHYLPAMVGPKSVS